MPNNSPFVASVNELLAKLEDNPTVDMGIELANQIVLLFGGVSTKSVEDVFESSLELPNAERYDSWFQPHPIFKSDRACFDLADSPLLQAKFYWLKKRSRQIIAGGVHFTPNYEDEEFTHNERYKVGLDFFLSPNGKSLQVVLSNHGNLRIVELSGRLNNTQKEIFEKWIGAGSLKSQEALHTTLWESFKLKSVNQKFYDGVSNSFTELLQHLKSIDKDEEEAKLFASRLLGRLLFCWFLRKKGIIDESIGYFNAHGTDATAYYKQSLERLFFLTLNTPIDERDELTKQHQKALFPELLVDDQPSLFKTDQKTPYLNGGLFEPHDNDWYKDDSLTLPEGFFTNLYDHFEEFNFTTDESSPEYEQIAIDPEMLGRVFESLLATQVDETGQQARKAKGAFYTPREIVSYMCKESLRNYLYNAVNNDEGTKESIDSLLDITDSEWAKSISNMRRDKIKTNRYEILKALDNVRILDPACGSGAFPMGMLQLVLKTYERLDPTYNPYKKKLQIIENNIYGVDIEPMAVEISRLRAWLSLIVDEDDPRSVDPLPNLDFKFIVANSLLPLSKDFQLGDDKYDKVRSKMQWVIGKYFNTTDKQEKANLRTEFNKASSSLGQTSLLDVETRLQKQLHSFKPFDVHSEAIFFDAKLMFGLSSKSPFDLVIGNPPYIQLQKNGGLLANIYQGVGYETFVRTGDIYSLFYERGLELTKKGSGLLCYITSNKWMRAGYGEKTRSYFISKNPIQLLDFGGFKVFESATVDTNILLIQNSGNKHSLDAVHFKNDYKRDDSLADYFDNHKINLSKLSSKAWSVGDEMEAALKEKIERIGKPLKNWDVKIYRGILTGCNEAFVIDEKTRSKLLAEDPKSEKIIKPLLRGKDIKKYDVQFKNIYIIATGYDTDIPNMYPSVYEHIKRIGEAIDRKEIRVKGKGVFKRDDQGKNWWNLRRCAYYDEFEGEKLLFPAIMSKSPEFSIDVAEGYYVMAPGNIIVGKNIRSLLGVFASKAAYYFLRKFYMGGGIEGELKINRLQMLPIPQMNEDLETKLSNLAMKLQNLDDETQKKELTEKIDHLVYQLYRLTPEEIEIIERA